MTAEAFGSVVQSAPAQPDMLGVLCIYHALARGGGRSLTFIAQLQHPAKEERDIGEILSLTRNPIVNSPLAREGEQL